MKIPAAIGEIEFQIVIKGTIRRSPGHDRTDLYRALFLVFIPQTDYFLPFQSSIVIAVTVKSNSWNEDT